MIIIHHRRAGSVFVAVLLLFFAHSVSAYSFDIGPVSEFEIHTDIQYDYYDCFDSLCESLDDGWRVANIDGRLKYYTGAYSLVFFDLGLDVGNETTSISSVFRPGVGSTSSLDDNNNNIQKAIIGFRYKQHEFTLGKHDPKTKLFGPSTNNYLSFKLSGFNDSRIDWFAYEVEESLYASSSGSFNRIFGDVYADSLDVNGALGVGVRGSDESRLSLVYDFLFETTFPGIDNVVFSLAARSLSNPASYREFDSYGLKVNFFNSDGSELVIGLSENDFGDYVEFSLEQIWHYRNKVKVGWTNFNVDSGADSRSNSVPITDASFLFFSYTRAISEVFSMFGEFSRIDASDSDFDSFLVGLKMSF